MDGRMDSFASISIWELGVILPRPPKNARGSDWRGILFLFLSCCSHYLSTFLRYLSITATPPMERNAEVGCQSH